MSNNRNRRTDTQSGGRGSPDNDTSVQDILSSLFALQSSGGSRGSTISLSGLNVSDIARLLGSSSRAALSSHIVAQDDDEEDDDYEDYEDDDGGGVYFSRTQTTSQQWFPPVKQPQEAGVALLKTGDFGKVTTKIKSRRYNCNLSRSFLQRFNRPVPSNDLEDMHSNLVPNSNGTTVATYEANMYTAQFSDDSSFYYTCAQDYKLHIFDMKAPPLEPGPIPMYNRLFRGDPGLVSKLPLRKVIQGNQGRWTITDANLSPDNERLIYSSITPTVYMTNTSPDAGDAQIPISFADPVRRGYGNGDGIGIWSCRFSADGTEVVAGGNGHIFVYDLLANKRTVKISAHEDDVNSCCWADQASGNVLVSASDDTYLKVWDRRSLGTSKKPSGVLVGHTEGITYVSAKGDGRYIISNGKDQAVRLWDLRKMHTSAEYDTMQGKFYGVPNFDYRYPYYPKPKYKAHPKDCSVMTYRGHSVLRTLIRCHFSPIETTGAQYIYSGSADGRIHIWSLDGTIVHILDRSKSLPMTFPSSGPEPEMAHGTQSNNCVRDVSWHTQEPVIMSASWDNGRGGTVIARHEYKGLSKLPGALEDWADKHRLEGFDSSNSRRSTRLQQSEQRGRRHLPGSFYDASDIDDVS